MKLASIINFILFVSLTITAQASFAKDANGKMKLVVLSSLSRDEGKSIFSSSNYDINKKIYDLSSRGLNRNDFNLSIVDSASLTQVWDTLHDTSVDGVIYIGHGGKGYNSIIGTDPMIVSKDMIDLNFAFQNAHPGLKYFAVVACFSDQLMSKIQQNHFYDEHRDLHLLTFKTTIGLYMELNYAIQNAYNILLNNYTDDMDAPLILKDKKKNKIELKITRENLLPGEKLMPAILVSKDINEIETGLDLLRGDRIEGESISIFIDPAIKSLSVDSALKEISYRPNLGKISIEVMTAGHECKVNPIVNKQGRLMGVTKNIYKLECI